MFNTNPKMTNKSFDNNGTARLDEIERSQEEIKQKLDILLNRLSTSNGD